jgi:hypothetical protein
MAIFTAKKRPATYGWYVGNIVNAPFVPKEVDIRILHEICSSLVF